MSALSQKTSRTPWPTVKLGDVCEVITDGNWIESKDQSSDGIRLIQTGNIGNGAFLKKEGRARYISEDTFNRLKCTEIFPGDILVSRLPEPVGRACIVGEINNRMITAVDCTIIRFKNTIDSRFFVLFSQTPQYQFLISSKVTGTTRARISRKNLSAIPIPLPPLDVQREIVAKVEAGLKEADGLVAHFKRLITLADETFKAELDEAFNALSAPTVKLGDVCEISAGGDAPKERMSKVKTDIFSIPIISNGVGNNAFYGYTDVAKISCPAVTIAARGTIGYTEYRDYAYFPIIRLLTAIPKDLSVLDTKYLYCYLQGKKYNVPIGAIPQLTAPELKNVTIPLPLLDIQREIVARLEGAKARCEQLRTEAERGLKAAEALRTAVLAEAFEHHE